jgi:hypothetical protein
VRSIVPAAACTMVALSVAGCTGGRSAAHHTEGRGTGTAVSATTPRAAIFVLAAGHSSRQHQITAPSLATYEFDVSISAPTSANVSLNALTPNGATLRLISSTRDRQDYSCRHQGSQNVCLGRFPLLPAQRGGIWTLLASKRSDPAATVRVVITFARP